MVCLSVPTNPLCLLPDRMKIYLDGQLVDEADAKVSVFDHGLLYGDGVFEGIRFYNGRVFKLEEHMDRLYDSAKVICLDIPMSKADLTQALLDTVRANGERDGYIRLVVTRGVGDLGINPRLCANGLDHHHLSQDQDVY